MKTLIAAALTAAIALLPVVGNAEPIKKPHRAHRAARAEQMPPAADFVPGRSGNAAMDGNNANSAYGSNSAGENAQGRTAGGGFGG